jgi:hypothetical protein
LVRELTAGTVALLEYYVEQHGAITSAQARLHALQVARYGDDNDDDDDDDNNEEREDDHPNR